MAVPQIRAMGWVRLALDGSLLMASVSFLCLIRLPLLPVYGHTIPELLWAYRLRVLVHLLPTALGLALMVSAERRFKRGYGDDLWTEAELAQVRHSLRGRIWGRVAGLIFLLWVVALFWQHSMRGGGVWYLLVMPGQLVQRIRNLITPRVHQPSPLADWRSFGQLRSEHWGQGEARF